MRHSVVWISQLLTPQLGLAKIQSYLKAFNYGNQDFSGDPGKDNGLMQAWLSSSLKISPNEQLTFLKALAVNQLPVSKQAMSYTKDNMYLETLSNGWRLHGKTGSGYVDQNAEHKHAIGWFVGFLEKDTTISYIFVLNFTDLDTAQSDISSGIRARSIAEEVLNQTLK